MKVYLTSLVCKNTNTMLKKLEYLLPASFPDHVCNVIQDQLFNALRMVYKTSTFGEKNIYSQRISKNIYFQKYIFKNLLVHRRHIYSIPLEAL